MAVVRLVFWLSVVAILMPVHAQPLPDVRREASVVALTDDTPTGAMSADPGAPEAASDDAGTVIIGAMRDNAISSLLRVKADLKAERLQKDDSFQHDLALPHDFPETKT